MIPDLETLLAPVPGEDPAGPDLAYDEDRAALEQVFERSVSIDASGQEGAQAEIPWDRVIGQIVAQSARTKDIWLPVYLCRAGAASGRLEVTRLGAEYLAGLVETYWDELHPKLEEYGFQGRKAACDSLGSRGQFLNPLEGAVVIEHPRFGRFTVADLDRFQAGGEGDETYAPFRAALDAVGDAPLAQAAAEIAGAAVALRRVDAALTTRAEGTTGPNFQPVYDAMERMRRAVLAFVAAPPEAEGESEPEAPTDDGQPTAPAPRGNRGRIETREQVTQAIDALIDYYRRSEPGSPIPLVLQRVRGWVGVDFLTILQEIAPNGLEEARRLLGSFGAEQ